MVIFTRELLLELHDNEGLLLLFPVEISSIISFTAAEIFTQKFRLYLSDGDFSASLATVDVS